LQWNWQYDVDIINACGFKIEVLKIWKNDKGKKRKEKIYYYTNLNIRK